MNINWRSQRGSQRRANCDAVTIEYTPNYLLVMFVDAAEKSPRSQEFSQHWASNIIHQQQKQLRHQYLHEIASYCMLTLELKSGCFHLISTGDCQAGVQDSGPIKWLTTPYRANQNLLTRSLNSKRFLRPDITESTLGPGASLILCSDGYWSEHLQKQTPFKQLTDDASVLTLAHGKSNLSTTSDTDNLVVNYR
jgi:serine/threonine protein phosphatase PrpC